MCISVLGVSPGLWQLRPEPGALDHASPELVERLRTDAFAYFRFINHPWTARVCEVFADEIRTLPTVRLHGDAHIGQFALTDDAWGLDDFDDAARGPAVVDIVRMLGSIELASRLRGWGGERSMLFDRFFHGYHRGLSQPGYRPPQPAIVGVLRRAGSRSREAFLAWGDALMEPLTDDESRVLIAAVEIFSRLMHREQPDLAPEYLRVVRAGWLHLGIGSALQRKVLIRLQGPSADPSDDELIEAKELESLGGLTCLEHSPSQPTLRVIAAARYLGRMKHSILAAGPEFVIPEQFIGPQQLRDWWIRSWDPSYREVQLSDLRSVKDLAEIAFDAGLQLGGGELRDDAGSQPADRKQALASITRLEKRLRTETVTLVDQLFVDWRRFAER